MVNTIVFIDPRVPNVADLVKTFELDVEIVFLGIGRDGLQQIAEWLETRQGIDAIHIVSHGAPASLQLGSSEISSSNLPAYKDVLSRISASLSPTGDILLYGCDIASGSQGRQFVEQLAAFTGADVAASNDATGTSLVGGDVDLEVCIGVVAANPLIGQRIADNLGLFLGTLPSAVSIGTGNWVWPNQYGNMSFSAQIASSSQVDQHRFNADVTGSYVISVGGFLDAQFRVYGSDGVPITLPVNNVVAGGGESVTLSLTAGSWYYVTVSGAGLSTGIYSLTVNGPDLVRNTVSLTSSNSGSAPGTVGNSGDIDYFAIAAPSGTSSLNLSVAPDASLNTFVELYDNAGTRLQQINNATTGGTDAANNVAVTAGTTYWIGVSSFSSTQVGGYTLNVDFNPDPSLPIISVAPLSADKLEGTNQITPFTFTVTRTGNTNVASSVNWAIGADQSPAADASDFGGVTSGSLNWNAGDTSSKTITLGVVGDTAVEGGGLPEHFTVTLSNPNGAAIGTGTARGAIQNDDTPPPVFSPFFFDARIVDRIDRDADGFASSLRIEFDVDSNASGNYYVKIYEDDLLFDDFLVQSPTFLVNGSAREYHGVAINADTYQLAHNTEEFKLELYNAATNQLVQTWTAANDSNLSNSLVELSGEDWSTTFSDLGILYHASIQRLDGRPIEDNIPTWLLVHGWNSNPDTFESLVPQIANRSTFQILTLDWRDGAFVPINPFVPEQRIQPVAAWAATVLTNHGFQGLNLNFVGHSFGSYISDEAAERIAGGVNTIIGLDPAANILIPANGYDPTVDVNFSAHSRWAWAFHDGDLINQGNEFTPTTADEAFVILGGGGVDLIAGHSAVTQVLANLLAAPGGSAGQNANFQLSELLDIDPGPWAPNNFASHGLFSPGSGYEAQINVVNGNIPSSITYISVLAEIAVSGAGTAIFDGDLGAGPSEGTDFGSVSVGSTVDRTFTVTNTGSGTLTTSGLTLPGGFILVDGLSASIGPGSFDTFTVRLDTSTAGIKSGQINFNSNDGDENPFNFQIAGTVNPPSAPEIAVSGAGTAIFDGDLGAGPSDGTDFGSVSVGSTVDRTFTVTNTGSGTLTTSGLTLPGGFILVDGLSASIGPGSFDTFTVRLDTSTAGIKSGQINFNSNDGDENPFNFQIAGTVNPPSAPEIAVSGAGTAIFDGDLGAGPSDGTDFGSVSVGSTVDRTFTVTNTGSGTLTTSGLTLPGGFILVDGLSASIGPGSFDTFTVRLDTSTAGIKSGQINFNSNDGDENPFNFQIAGTVNPPSAPEIAVSGAGTAIFDGDLGAGPSDGTDFGSVSVGSTVDRTFTVTNTGSGTLTTSGLTLPGGFILVDGLSASIGPGSFDTFTVRLDTSTAGIKSGQINFNSNDGDENPFNFQIAGTVNPPLFTEGPDTVTLTQPNETWNGLGGADNVTGTSSHDVIFGGNGEDILLGEGGDDELYGESESDALIGGEGSDTLNGGGGTNDMALYISASAGVVVELGLGQATGADGTDTLIAIENVGGSDWGDVLGGNDGNNFLWGFDGADFLQGNGGNDTLSGGLQGDALDGGAGSDWADYRDAQAGITANLASGGTGGEAAGDTYTQVENIRGSTFADNLAGDAGDNLLRGGLGADVLNGDAGSDWVDFGLATVGVSASLTSGGTSGEATGDTYIAIENLRGSNFADRLAGDGGSNFLRGGLGADTLNGGAGIDWADYADATEAVTVDLGTGGTGGEAAGDTYAAIENIGGTTFSDNLAGDGGNNYLRGGLGADVLNGDAGSDWVDFGLATAGVSASLTSGGTSGEATGDTYIAIENLRGSNFADRLAGDGGSNFLRGGLGADTLNGGAGIDWADYGAAAVGVNANMATGGTGGEASGDTYVAIENIIGSSFADSLIGTVGNNFLRGGLGADALDGGAGSDWADYATATSGITANLSAPGSNTGEAAGDTYASIEHLRGSNFGDRLTGDAGANFLRGGLGADTLDGGSGGDWADYSGAAGAVTANLVTGGSGGEALNDTYTSIENILGTSFSDSLTGSAVANGLRGGLGNDILDGGNGLDQFYFDTALNALTNVDTVIGFVVADDTIRLDDAVFTAVGAPGILAAGAFVSGSQALEADDRIIYDGVTGNLFYDANGSSAGLQIKFAHLDPGLALTNADFLVT